MSENAKLFLLGLIILYDTVELAKWEMGLKNKGGKTNVYRKQRRRKSITKGQGQRNKYHLYTNDTWMH